MYEYKPPSMLSAHKWLAIFFLGILLAFLAIQAHMIRVRRDRPPPPPGPIFIQSLDDAAS
jgi:hypothetical protein